jgi:hypothetical protein
MLTAAEATGLHRWPRRRQAMQSTVATEDGAGRRQEMTFPNALLGG